MGTTRSYSKQVLAYSNTEVYVQPVQKKDNLVGDVGYVQPIIDHPACVDAAPSTIQLGITEIVLVNNQFRLRVSITQQITAVLNFSGQIDVNIQPFGQAQTVDNTVPCYFNGTIFPGATDAIFMSSFINTPNFGDIILGPDRYGITNYSPATSGSSTIVNQTPY